MSGPVKSYDIEIPHNFSCRDYQRPFFEAMKSGKKRAVLVWHRRCGKDKTCWNYMIMKAAAKVGVYNYYAPTYKQGKKIIWENIDNDSFHLLKHIPKELIDGKPNETELKIRLKNGSVIQIIGTEDINSIVGSNPIGCVFTEFSLQSPAVWEFIRPILDVNGGWAVFNFTPRGQNHAKVIYDMAIKNPNYWYSQLLTVKDTNIITEEDLEQIRKEGMSEDMIQQEYFCSFTLGVEGNYYGRYMQEAEDQDRIGKVPWDQTTRVNTVWDIGVGDSTAIIFYQLVGNEIHVIDYYENAGEGLPHYAQLLFSKPYLYTNHYAPHDIDSRAFSSGLSARTVGRSLGINFTVLPTLQRSFDEGIEALRGIFPRLWFNEEKTKRLLECLQNYRKEFDQKLQVYKTRPVHNWASHGADAARYLAVAVKTFSSSVVGMSDDDVEVMMDKHKPRFNN